MTNFELITQNSSTLEQFLEMVVDDALAAKGCSYDLTMPVEDERVLWREWLEREGAEEGTACETSWGTIWRLGGGGETDG